MTVNFPELALIRFKVMDKDLNEDDFIGSYTLPVNSLVSGYRHVHLTNAGKPLANASIFVHVDIQEHVATSKPVSCGEGRREVEGKELEREGGREGAREGGREGGS